MAAFGGQDFSRHSADGEVDLSQLIRILWQGRWRIFVLATCAMLAVLVFYAARYLSPAYTAEYSIVVELAFPNADAGKYPNGQPFTVSDISASHVLQTVYSDLNIESYGMTLADFTGRISVKPFAVTGDFIDQRYKVEIGAKKLGRHGDSSDRSGV